MASIAATRYAQAFFDLGKEEDKLSVFKDDLIAIDEIIKQNDDLSRLLKHPKVDKEERKNIVKKVFGGTDDLTMNFLKLLVDRNRFMNIHDIKNQYISLYNEANDIAIAYIYSAKTLSEEELQSIVKMLEKRYKKTIEYKTRIDESLIAGIRVKVGDDVLDNTLDHQLDRMKEAVKKENH